MVLVLHPWPHTLAGDLLSLNMLNTLSWLLPQLACPPCLSNQTLLQIIIINNYCYYSLLSTKRPLKLQIYKSLTAATHC